MKKVILELNLPEAMKLVSVCNAAIAVEEAALASTLEGEDSYKLKLMSEASADTIKMLKAKIKTAIAERKECDENPFHHSN